ncbi:MAG: hypothetical protein ACYCXG_00680 [Acidiferrobacter sp.]
MTPEPAASSDTPPHAHSYRPFPVHGPYGAHRIYSYWRVIDNPPVRFCRAAGMQPLSMPVKGGSVEALRSFLNVQSDADFVLVVARALAVLREGTQEWWSDRLAREPEELDEDEEPATPDREGLRQFVGDEVLPWFENRKKELANRPLIREQASGESLDLHKLERLGHYEVHLDRKLKRMLSMLLRLKEMRQGTVAA